MHFYIHLKNLRGQNTFLAKIPRGKNSTRKFYAVKFPREGNIFRNEIDIIVDIDKASSDINNKNNELNIIECFFK